jgi:uncharacterized protein (DUF433 family)
MQTPRIIDRGRGPEIEGTRITVYDIYEHYRHGWNSLRIACEFWLGTPQVDAAIAYIESHRPQIEAEYAKMVERSRRGNSPEVRALLPQLRAKFQERLRRYGQEHPA